MATEDINFRLTVDGATAKRELDAIRGSALTMGGALEGINKAAGRVDQSFSALEKVMRQTGAATSDTGKSMLDLVGSVGDVAMAFSVGGPMMGALAATTAAVGLLTKHWDNLIRKQDEAIEKQYEHQFGLIDENKVLEKRLDNLRRRSHTETAAEAYLRVQKEIDAATKLRDASRAAQDNRDWVFLNRRIEMLKEIQTLEASAIAQANAKGASGGVAGRSSKWGGPDVGTLRFMMDVDAATAAREQAAAESAAGLAAGTAAFQAEFDAAQAHHLRLTDLHREQAERRVALDAWAAEQAQLQNERIAASTNAVYGDSLNAVLGGATTAFQSFFTGLAAGEKHAAEQATAAFLSGVGNQLVGIGTKAIFEGAIISANPLTPGAGLPMMGLGAAAVVAGIGMGAGGAAISASIPSGSTDRASSDRGVNSGRRFGGGATTNEPVTVQIVYSAAGPAPEDTAREITRAIRTARQRGIA